MFLVITRVLLWLLIGIILVFVLSQLLKKQEKTVIFLGMVLICAIIILGFFTPNLQITLDAWRIVSIPLNPLGLFLTLNVIVIVPLLTQGKIEKPGSFIIWLGLIILLLSSTPFIAYHLVQKIEMEAIEIQQRKQDFCQGDCPSELLNPRQQRVGAIVLLGQGTTQAALPYRKQIQLTDSGDRIIYTADLYNQQRTLGNLPTIIVSAGPRTYLEAESTDDCCVAQQVEALDIRTLLEQRFRIPSQQIQVEPNGVDLYTSAVEVKEILKRLQLTKQKMMLVTSGVKIRRATLTFEHLGLTVIPEATDFYAFQPKATPQRKFGLEDFIPSPKALVISSEVIEEYLASVYYFLRGWLSPKVF